MKKITKNTTSKKKTTNIARPAIKSMEQEYYRDMFSFTMKPISQEYLLKLALEWVDTVASNEDILVLEEYAILKGIQYPIMHRWMKRCPELQEAHDHVMCILSVRREKGALNNKLNTVMVVKSMAMYNMRWKDIEEWRAQMSEKIAGATGQLIVEMNKYPETQEVPRKKDKR